MPCFALTIAYVGTRYAGWQIQDASKAPLTVQGELEKILAKVAGTLVRVHSAGRTDSGVHAEGQVAHICVDETQAHHDWQRIFNAQLPTDISVLAVRRMHENFHSRFDALHKTYVYTFWTERNFMPPRLRPFAWNCGALDVQTMSAALPYLLGRHNFACFQNIGTPLQDTVRTVLDIRLDNGSPWLPRSMERSALRLTVTADGFLKQMVRNMAGLLWSVGKGKFCPQDIPSLIEKAQRKLAPPTAPACGLTLLSVAYPHVKEVS